MKCAIVVSVFKTKFGPIVFKENLEENIKAASSLGYDAVELAVKNPESVDVKSLQDILKAYNMPALTFGTGQIFFDQGLSFSDRDAEIRKKAVSSVKNVIDLASNFGASVIIGLIRGKVNADDNGMEQELADAENSISTCLKECMDYSGKSGTKFLLEPINRYETNIFNTLDSTGDFLNRNKNTLDLARIGILADTFHMNIEEPSIEKSFEKHINMIKHVHFADSNRWAPGYGHTDFEKIYGVLKANDYNGYISFEVLPLPDPLSAAKNAIAYVKNLERKFK